MFAWIATAASWIWGAISAGAAVAAASAWSAIVAIWNALKTTGHVLALFGKHTWGFLRDAWDKVFKPALDKVFLHPIQSLKDLWSKVLRPAWGKFNKWVDTAHDWLAAKFGPIICWLQRARRAILDFWKAYVQPWLDLIDTTRKFLRVLEALHVKWAKQLDNRLGAIEGWINDKFAFVLRQINEAIAVVDRIVGADGLFQRLYFIRTIQRDYDLVWKALRAPYDHPLSSRDLRSWTTAVKVRDFNVIQQELYEYLENGTGPKAKLLDELIQSAILRAKE